MKVAYLDRDGVINKKAKDHQYITNWNDFEFLNNGLYLLENLVKLKYKIIIVTNQQGIGKGLFTKKQLIKIHDNMRLFLERRGINIQKIYYCPHLIKEKCNCRQPQIGMFTRSLIDFPDINTKNSIMIGDSQSDVDAGLNFGIKSFLFSNNKESVNNILINLKIE